MSAAGQPSKAAPAKRPADDGQPEGEDILGRAYDARLMLRLWQFVRPYQKVIWFSMGLLLLATGAQLLQPYLVRLAVDLYVVPAQHPTGLLARAAELSRSLGLGRATGLLAISALLLVVVLFEQGVRFAQLYFMQLVGQRTMKDLRDALHRHISQLAMSFFDRTPVGRVMTRLTSDVESLSELFTTGIVAAIGDLVFLLGLAAVLFSLNVRLALIAFAAVPVLLGAVALFRQVARRIFREIRVRLARINAFLQEHITGMKVVQLFGQQPRVQRDFDERNLAFMRANADNIRYDATLFAFVEMVSNLVIAALLWFAGGKLLAARLGGVDGAITFGVLVAFIDYTRKFFVPIRDLSERFSVLQQAMASAERIFGLLDTEEMDAPVTAAAPATPAPATPAPAKEQAAGPHVVYEAIEFSYKRAVAAAPTLLAADEVAVASGPGRPPSVGRADDGGTLRGVDLIIGRGEQLAIVGATGAGKTTLAKLLLRLYEPVSGRLLLGGRDVRTLAAAELRRRVVLVPQDVFLFTGDLYSNITLLDPTLTLERVEEAGARIGLDRLAARLPGGYRAPIQERGSNLSAGERQLIAFARALVRDPEVLVLDEATANVDPEAEERIQAATDLLLERRTAIIIAHRLSTLERATRLIVMQQGRIVEQGTHAELLAQEGIYARLRRLQQV